MKQWLDKQRALINGETIYVCIYTHIYIEGDRKRERERERDTNVYDLVVSPRSEGGQILLNPAAFRLTPMLHFDWQCASSLLNPTFTLSSSTCFLHVLLASFLSFDLQPQNLMPFWRHDHSLSSTHDYATNKHCLP